MYYLVEYQRAAGQLRSLRPFADHRAAQDERLAAELRHLREGVDIEVVVLDAPDEAALRRSHGRYFMPVRDLIARMQANG
jgi:hypothetical protein